MMAGYIFYRVVRLGFSQIETYELIKVLKVYERNYGHRWLGCLLNNYEHHRYPLLDRYQTDLIERLFNKSGATQFIQQLNTARIRAEQLPEDKEPLYKRIARGEPYWR